MIKLGSIYIRNLRPNQVNLRLGNRPNDLKLSLTRRGTREDSTSVPEELTNLPTFRRSLNAGLFEILDEEAYMALIELDDARLAEDILELAEPKRHQEPIVTLPVHTESNLSEVPAQRTYETHLKEIKPEHMTPSINTKAKFQDVSDPALRPSVKGTAGHEPDYRGN